MSPQAPLAAGRAAGRSLALGYQCSVILGGHEHYCRQRLLQRDRGLKAWGFNSTEPNASVINWQAGQSGAIANGVILMGCLGCAYDITIKAFGDATHVIIDVMGYFQEASATASTVTTFTGFKKRSAGLGTER